MAIFLGVRWHKFWGKRWQIFRGGLEKVIWYRVAKFLGDGATWDGKKALPWGDKNVLKVGVAVFGGDMAKQFGVGTRTLLRGVEWKKHFGVLVW